MKNLNNRIRISSILLLVIAMLVAVTCSDIYDNVEKYVDGEIVYIDKLDGILKVQIGYERVEIDLLEAGRIPATQIFMAKATKTVIECPDFTEPGNRRVIDSICSWVNVKGLTQLKYYDLTIYTEDQYGNRSLPMKTAVRPFTEESLNALEITPPAISASSSAAQIEWIEGLSALTHQVVSYEWQYTDRDGAVKKDGEDGDRPVIFLENVATEIDIPVILKCKLIPTIGNPDHTYTPIIDVVDFQQTLYFRLSSNADEVIFLKAPMSGIDNDLTDNSSVAFSWTKLNDVNGYTMKFSLNPSFPEGATASLNVGDVNEYVMNNDGMLQVFNSLLTKGYSMDLYWTVTPTVQSAQVKTSFRLLKVWKAGIFYQYDRTDWLGVGASSTYPGTEVQNILNENQDAVWHTADVTLPHWLIVDMRTPKSVFKFDVYRMVGGLSDTKSMEFYLGDSPDHLTGTWTKIAAGGFAPTTSGIDEPSCEILTTDKVTQGRYLRILFLDGRAGGNPYVNVVKIHVFYQ